MWKRISLVLALVCVYQTYRGCTRSSVKKVYVDNCPKADTKFVATDGFSSSGDGDRPRPTLDAPATAGSGPSFKAYGFTVTAPAWASMLMPNKGETIKSYKDRMLPVAEHAIAPQRARVAQLRDALAKAINMDGKQRAELDGAASETANALENRVMQAFADGSFDPSTFKPMTAVNLAKDLVDTVSAGNSRWMSSLSDTQRTQLSQNPFDFGDYLMFSTKWEDLLKVFD